MIGECFRFYRRDQLPNETINDYVAELKRLTTHCQCRNSLDSKLRDRFVCGVSAEKVQEDLLTKENDLTFDQAVAAALSKATATKDMLDLQSKSTGAVQHLSRDQKQQRRRNRR